MSIKSLIRNLAKAMPTIIAHAPAVIAAVSEIGRAVKKPKVETTK